MSAKYTCCEEPVKQELETEYLVMHFRCRVCRKRLDIKIARLASIMDALEERGVHTVTLTGLGYALSLRAA